MLPPLLSGLRGRLLLLVVLAAVPSLALTVYAGWRDQQHQRANVAESTLRLARLVAGDQERIIDGTRQILSDLAQVPEVRSGDPVRSRTFFALLMKQYRGYASFTVLDPAGNVLVSLPRSPEPVNLSDRSWFRDALAARTFAVGDYQVGVLTKKPVVVTAWPVVNTDGTVTALITAALDVEWLNQITATRQLTPGGMLALIDRHGRILARHPNGEDWIGRQLPEAQLSGAIRTHPDGTVEARGSDTVSRIYGFTSISGRTESGLRVVVGVPRQEAYAAIRDLQSRQLLALGLVAVLTLTAAWFGSQRLVLRPVAALLSATRRLAAGDRSARTRLSYGQGELSHLAFAFDEMACALEARQVERDRAEHALRESEERFRAFMDNSPAIASVKDDKGRYVYANPAFERALGLAPGGWQGLEDRHVFATATAASLERADQEVRTSREPRQLLETVRRADGSEGYWLSVKFPLAEASGRTLLASMAVDLTEGRQIKEALRRSERQYTELAEQATDGIVVTGPDRRLVAVNPAACAMSGRSREELLGRPVGDVLSTVELDSLRAASPGTSPPDRLRAVFEAEFLRKDGTSFPAEISARLLEDGSIQAIIRDITSRHEAEAALRASEERFRRLYHSLPLAYQSLSLDGTIVEVNQAWVGLTGLSRERAIGRKFVEMLPADSRPRFEERLRGLASVPELRDVEFTIARGRRPPAVVSLNGRVGQGASGEPLLHCVLHDVTESREAEQLLRQSEQRYRTIFADSPVSLWEEDFSGIKRHIDRLRSLEVTDLDAHFKAHPEELADCVETVTVVDVNKATLALYGADDPSQMRAGLDRIVGADGYEVFKNAILALDRGERSWESQGINYTLSGEKVVLALRWSLAPGAEDTWSRVIVSAMDVTERQRADAAIRESELRLERAFRLAPGLMSLTTRDGGRYVDVNEAFTRELGFSREEVIGRSASDVGVWVNPQERQRLLDLMGDSNGLDNVEVRLRRRSGAVLEGLCSVAPLVVNGEDCILVHVADVTARKRAEEIGRETQRMLATLMSNLPGMAYQCCDDPEWTMLFVSDGCLELTGYEPSDLVGNRRASYGSLIVEEDRDAVFSQIRQAVLERRPFRIEYRLRRRDGSTRWVWEQGRAVPSAGGDVLEGFISDITDRRRAQEALGAAAVRSGLACQT